MPITQAQATDRTTFMGSSDVPALLLGGGYALWLEKTGKSTRAPGGKAAELGKILEDGLLEYVKDYYSADGLDPGHSHHHVSFTKNAERRCSGTCIKVHVDALMKMDNGEWWAVEAKTHGLFNPWRIDDQWGKPGTDEVPDYVYIQCQTHMAASGAVKTVIPALIPGRGLNLYYVEHDEAVMKEIVSQVERFWNDNVKAGVAPSAPGDDEHIGRSLEVSRRRARLPETFVVGSKADQKMAEEWIAAKKARSMVDELVDRKEANVLGALGEAECIVFPDETCVTYTKSERKGYIAKPTSYYTLRHARKIPKGMTPIEEAKTYDDQ